MKQPRTDLNSPKFECNKNGFLDYLTTCKNYDVVCPNPWQAVADKVRRANNFYDYDGAVGEGYACNEDLILLQKHNENRTNEKHIFALDVAPTPFEGDVFTAKIIVLSGNPFLSDERNRTDYVKLDYDAKKRITDYSINNLELNGEMLLDDKVVNKMRQYWKKKTKNLQGIVGFDSRDIAIIQYVGYPSLEMNNTAQVKRLKSVEFTRDLIEFIAKYRTDDYCFLIGRKKAIWQPFLQSLFNEQYDKYVVELNSSSNQTISKKNVTDWEKIESLIHQAHKQRITETISSLKKDGDNFFAGVYEKVLKNLET